MKVAYILTLAPLMMFGTAHAQDAPTTAPQDSSATSEIPDEEVAQFALAALFVEQIAADETMDAEHKQAAMASAVTQAGIEPQRFNTIATASQSDPELQQRIQVAAERHIATAQQNQGAMNQ